MAINQNYFSRHCQDKYEEIVSKPRQSKRERAFWQRKFLEHTIRDNRDFINHVEYIHYNPVKHGLVTAPKDLEYSSFHRYVNLGLYDEMWGQVKKCCLIRILIMNKLTFSFGFRKLYPSYNLENSICPHY